MKEFWSCLQTEKKHQEDLATRPHHVHNILPGKHAAFEIHLYMVSIWQYMKTFEQCSHFSQEQKFTNSEYKLLVRQKTMASITYKLAHEVLLIQFLR